MKINLKNFERQDNDTMDEFIGVRLTTSELMMLQTLADKTNINSISKLIRKMIRTAFEQNIVNK